MAEFHRLWKRRGEVLTKLHELLRDAQENHDLEHTSVLRIQRLYRGYKARCYIWSLNEAAGKIQRQLWRHMQSLRAHMLAKERERVRQSYVFHYHAVCIQRAYRGHYSRKYRHDFHARKRYLMQVVEKGNELREQLQKHFDETKWEHENAERERRMFEFTHLTQNLHHLVSTAVVPGVYALRTDQQPTIDGKPVEWHLTAGVKDLLRSKGLSLTHSRSPTRSHTHTNLNGSLRVQYDPPGRLSLQASSNYEAVREEQRSQAKLSKLRFVGTQDFKANGRSPSKPYKRGINDGQPYIDNWRNVYLMRGVPKNQAELSSQSVSWSQAPETPYVTAVGGNKSTVLPNGLFDVMAEAEQAGGVAFRHRGKTQRFGVPDTCDVRPKVVVPMADSSTSKLAKKSKPAKPHVAHTPTHTGNNEYTRSAAVEHGQQDPPLAGCAMDACGRESGGVGVDASCGEAAWVGGVDVVGKVRVFGEGSRNQDTHEVVAA